MPGNYAEQNGRRHGILFTAGPLSTSQTVRAAQMDDYGSRDSDFLQAIAEVRTEVLKIAHAPASDWACVPMQGCGTMGVESAIHTIISPGKPSTFLVLRNGSYSYRMANIVKQRGLSTLVTFDWDEGVDIDLVAFESFLQATVKEHPDLAAVGLVHSETSTGMINPIEQIAPIVRKHCPSTTTLLIDCMSSFGGYDIDVPAVADVIVTSANKCIQGVPGFSLVIARKVLLQQCRGNSISFTLDVTKVWDGLEKDGQFLFTPPVQAIVAFRQALREFWAEGGITARAARYKALNAYVADRMTSGECGFKLFLDREKPSYGYIITAFHSPPKASGWDFEVFYKKLKDAGFVIYPGKASHADTFRIGTFGDITIEDCKALMDTVVVVLKEMGVKLAV